MHSKQPFVGKFTINNEENVESTRAYSPDQAKIFMARKIARKQGVIPSVVLGYLKDHPHSYEIKMKA